MFCERPNIGRLPVFSAVLLAIVLAGHVRIAAQSSSRDGFGIAIRVPDTELVDQNGRTIHLYSDLVKGKKLVVINTMFTTCGTICPMVGIRISSLQRSLGPCSHNEYSFISISVDPTIDTPERLRKWGQKFGAGDCWKLLTGPKADVDAALKTLHLLPSDKLSHSPSALIGHDGGNDWTLCNVLASPTTLLQIARKNMSGSIVNEPRQ